MIIKPLVLMTGVFILTSCGAESQQVNQQAAEGLQEVSLQTPSESEAKQVNARKKYKSSRFLLRSNQLEGENAVNMDTIDTIQTGFEAMTEFKEFARHECIEGHLQQYEGSDISEEHDVLPDYEKALNESEAFIAALLGIPSNIRTEYEAALVAAFSASNIESCIDMFIAAENKLHVDLEAIADELEKNEAENWDVIEAVLDQEDRLLDSCEQFVLEEEENEESEHTTSEEDYELNADKEEDDDYDSEEEETNEEDEQEEEEEEEEEEENDEFDEDFEIISLDESPECKVEVEALRSLINQ